MESLQLPEELVAFLNSERQLEYEPDTCEAGAVTLLPRTAMKLRMFGAHCGGTPHEADDPHDGPGVYLVPGVDLVASCTNNYEPEGLLVWLPGEQSFGVWDPDHDYLLVFGSEVSWSKIVSSPARHINTQWAFEGLDRAPAEFLVPWPKYPHE